MIVKLLTEQDLEFLSLKGGCRGSSESTLVKMSICWKSHAAAHIIICDKMKQCKRNSLAMPDTVAFIISIYIAMNKQTIKTLQHRLYYHCKSINTKEIS